MSQKKSKVKRQMIKDILRTSTKQANREFKVKILKYVSNLS